MTTIIPVPNGNGGVTLAVLPGSTTPEPPESYTGHYTTKEGVEVEVKYNTSNRSLYEQIEAKMLCDLSWTLRQEQSVEKNSLSLSILTCALISGALCSAAVAIAFFAAIFLHFAALIEFNTITEVLKFSIRASLLCGPLMFLYFSYEVYKDHIAEMKVTSPVTSE